MNKLKQTLNFHFHANYVTRDQSKNNGWVIFLFLWVDKVNIGSKE